MVHCACFMHLAWFLKLHSSYFRPPTLITVILLCSLKPSQGNGDGFFSFLRNIFIWLCWVLAAACGI